MSYHESVFVSLLLAIQISFVCLGEIADEIEITESRIADPSISEVQRLCLLLAHPAVQADLGLTSNQVQQIEGIQRIKAEDIVGVSNLLAKIREAEIGEKPQLVEQMLFHADEHRLALFFTVLTPSQSNRLQAIALQVRGLMSLVVRPELMGSIGLSEEQAKDFIRIYGEYVSVLNILRRRLGRQQIAGLYGEETIEDRIAEVKCLRCVIRAIEKELQGGLWTILTESQRKKWLDITGPPIRLD